MGKRQGTLCVKVDNGRKIKIKDVIECENLTHNLLSVRKLEEKGLKIIFETKNVKIKNGDLLITEGLLKGNLYILNFNIQIVEANLTHEDDNELWHRRMGHSFKYLCNKICETCLQGKQTKLPYKPLSSERKPKRILEVVSTDVCGPITPISHDGKRYYITFIDHYSHFAVCYCIAYKSEALDKFKIYVAMVEVKFACKIEKLGCDNGGEYISNDFKAFCERKGITMQYTIPYIKYNSQFILKSKNRSKASRGAGQKSWREKKKRRTVLGKRWQNNTP